ncbi:hypothetical protein AB0L70_15345 [Kribbella sp. NPDC051952]|uniref:hypothetical protein n=1 Tax=Kribbella sp. NPDC051952 TaxID=3154851 RepID=UPI00342D841B
MATPFAIRYDRRVSESFLSLFRNDNVLSRLRVIAQQAALPLDLQMRKNPKTRAQWASLYAGLTSVLDVHQVQEKLKFKVHPTWSHNARYGFKSAWREPMDLAEVRTEWLEIERYLERVIPPAVRAHAMAEGAVQAVISKKTTDDWAILDREVTPSFKDNAYKQAVLTECMQPLLASTRAAATLVNVPAGPKKFGTECDLLALDSSGRLLAIEVKPLGAATIAWVPAQATMYARVLQHWIDTDPTTATDGVTPRQIIEGMLHQRQELGHSPGFTVNLTEPMTVIPVVVLQAGASKAKHDQMLKVRDLLTKHVRDVAPVKIYEVSILGDFTPIT